MVKETEIRQTIARAMEGNGNATIPLCDMDPCGHPHNGKMPLECQRYWDTVYKICREMEIKTKMNGRYLVLERRA